MNIKNFFIKLYTKLKRQKPDTKKDTIPLIPIQKPIPIDKRGRPLGRRYKSRPIPSHIVKLKSRTAYEKRLWNLKAKEEDEE